jgi:hypothetical protein
VVLRLRQGPRADEQTLAIFHDYSLYSPSIDGYCNVRLVVCRHI